MRRSRRVHVDRIGEAAYCTAAGDFLALQDIESIMCMGPNSARSAFSATASQNELKSGSMPLVQGDEIPQRHGKIDILHRVERIDFDRLLKRGDDQHETNRIQTAFCQLQLIGQWREPLSLRLGYSPES
jgi:hypothetical protein